MKFKEKTHSKYVISDYRSVAPRNYQIPMQTSYSKQDVLKHWKELDPDSWDKHTPKNSKRIEQYATWELISIDTKDIEGLDYDDCSFSPDEVNTYEEWGASKIPPIIVIPNTKGTYNLVDGVTRAFAASSAGVKIKSLSPVVDKPDEKPIRCGGQLVRSAKKSVEADLEGDEAKARTLNSSSIFISKRDTDIKGVDSVYSITLRTKNQPTKVIIFIKDDKVAIIEPNVKYNIFHSPAFQHLLTLNVETLLLKFETAWKMLLSEISKTSHHAYEDVYPRVLKLYGNGKTKTYNWMSKAEARALLIKNGILDGQISRDIPDLEIEETEHSTLKHGNITLYGFDEKKNADIIKWLDEAETKLKNVGLGDLVYGKVFLVPKRNSTNLTLADYSKNDDTIRMFKAAGEKTPVKTIIHELGHRFYYKKLKTTTLSKIYERYKKELKDHQEKVKDIKVEVGTKYSLPEKGVLEYAGLGTKTLNGRKYVHKLYILKEDGTRSNRFFAFDSVSDMLHFIEKPKSSENPWLPSQYSKKNEVEWFAEIFAYSVLDNSKEVLDWIKSLV